ncbi:MAG: ATP-binding cassette domain-containing protein, partial [Acetatifactor sp.]|nr:ATP-binding cassette domain-containing protein [Acetatifactor sp.]
MADLELKHIYYAYPRTKNQVLQEVNAIFPGGQVCSICGQSGAGKSTLLYLAAGIDMPVAGEVIYEGRILTRDMLDEYRRKDASIISQNYLLFPTWTVLENVCYPMELVKREKREAVA